MRIPPNYFGIALGLSGLSEAWAVASPLLGIQDATADAIAILAAATWLILLVGYLAQGTAQLLADYRDPVLAPFLSVALITPMILATELAPVAPTAGRVIVIVFLVLTIAFGGWLTGQWIVGEIPPDAIHPGYFLPTVAGGLISSYAAGAVQLPAVAKACFGIGVTCWLLVGSTLLHRLFVRPSLPAALVPTLAIELAPPAVAGFAYFTWHGPRIDTVAYLLGGYAVLMALVQLRFVPVYARLRFTPGFWAFTFSYAAAAIDALSWLRIARPPGAEGYAGAVLTLITVAVAGVAARTVVALARGQLRLAAVRM
jgi:tellurite resistance protein